MPDHTDLGQSFFPPTLYRPASGDWAARQLRGGRDEEMPPTISAMRRALSLPGHVLLRDIYSTELCDKPAAARRPKARPDLPQTTNPAGSLQTRHVSGEGPPRGTQLL